MNTRNTHIPLIVTVVGLTALALGAASPARATLLVYEGFSGYNTAANLSGQAVSSSTIGLNSATTWAGTNSVYLRVQDAGLSFGSLQTSGGALAISYSTAWSLGAQISATVAPGSTLWSSYLVSFSSQGAAAGDGLLMRIGDTTGNDSGAPNNIPSRFTTWADSRASSKSVGVSYGNTANADGNGATDLSLNTTYLLISSFTNVGAAGGGTATTWALTEAQFESFILAGGTEEYLRTSGNVTATATQTQTTQRDFSGYLTLAGVNDVAVVDELRWGTTLASVTPVPEPAAVATLAGLVIGLIAAGRRSLQRKHSTP